MDFTPTDEQTAVLDALKAHQRINVEAYAGCGKTSTLKMLAQANPDKRFFYTAFNKAIVETSKGSMPDNVEVRTTHSMAWAKANRPRLFDIRRQPGFEQAKILDVKARHLPYGNQTRRVAGGWLAAMGIQTLRRWCESGDEFIGAQHVAYPRVVLEDETGDWLRARPMLANIAQDIAERAWDDIRNPRGRLRWDHAHYLKMYQLAGMYPEYTDVVLLDEAQDTNGVTLAIMDNAAKAGAQIVLVGDRYQEIYGWRGAISAMDTAESDITCHLTGSWRFGARLAEVANLILGPVLGATLPLRGMATEPGTVAPTEHPNAVLARTNAAVMSEAIKLHTAGLKVLVMGGTDEVASFVRAAMSLKAGRTVEHVELGAFETWAQVQDYVDTDPGGEDLKLLVDMIDDPAIGPEKLLMLAEGKGVTNPDVVVSTGHKAKGLEWATVQLLGDFHGPRMGRTPVAPGERFTNAETVRLLYVAATRAQKHLDCGQVGFLAQYLKPATAG